MPCEIKTCIKHTIKKSYNGIHDASEFENIIKELNQLIKPQYPELKLQTIKKILSKYSHCEKAHIIIDTKNVMILSPQSPLGIKLMGKKINETVEINGVKYFIECIQ